MRRLGHALRPKIRAPIYSTSSRDGHVAIAMVEAGRSFFFVPHPPHHSHASVGKRSDPSASPLMYLGITTVHQPCFFIRAAECQRRKF